MNRIANGEFVVELLPLDMEGQPEDFKIVRTSINKSISGGLVATAVGQLLSAMTEVKDSAGYVPHSQGEPSLLGLPVAFADVQRASSQRRAQSGPGTSVISASTRSGSNSLA